MSVNSNIQLPPLDIVDKRLRGIIATTWHRLSKDVRAVLLNVIVGISELPEWGNMIKQSLDDMNIRRNCSNWNQFGKLLKGEVQFSKKDYDGISDDVLVGSFLHELGHAYQTAITPCDVNAINKAGDRLPISWEFRQEIEAVIRQRQIDTE